MMRSFNAAIKPKRRGSGWRVAAATLVPFIMILAYLLLSRWLPSWETPFSDWAAGAFSILSGVVFIATLPVCPRTRVLLLAIYIPVLITALLCFSMFFLGAVFDD